MIVKQNTFSVKHFGVSLPDKMFHLRNWQRLLRHCAAWLWNAHVTGAQLSQLPVSTSTASPVFCECAYLRQRRKRFNPNETKPAAASHWSELLVSKNLDETWTHNPGTSVAVWGSSAGFEDPYLPSCLSARWSLSTCSNCLFCEGHVMILSIQQNQTFNILSYPNPSFKTALLECIWPILREDVSQLEEVVSKHCLNPAFLLH